MSVHTSRTSYEDTTKGMVALGVGGFAGVMLIMVSCFQVMQGIAAIADDAVYVKGIDYVYELDVTAWGWVHLVLGLVGVATGIAILARQTLGLIFGIFIAAITSLTNFAFLPYYPLWSLLIVGFNVLVIWALCSQLASDRPADVPPSS
jgi:hypothetical protein